MQTTDPVKAMKDYIDLLGASGASYRFRAWPEGAWLPRTGGHYLYVRQDAGRVTVVRIAQTDDLSQARDGWSNARRRGATHLYTRLNVSGQTRAAEHRDLAAGQRRPRMAPTAAYPTALAAAGDGESAQL